MSLYNYILSALILLFSACNSKSAPGGEIIVRNDILDKEYNSFTIDQIITKNGAVSYSKHLKPSEQAIVPFKNISQMRIIRKYEDHSKVYQITCPSDFNTAIVIKLIDVHTNRMGGGCVLNKRGIMSKGGFVKWE